ncbi:hypothetical protein ACIRU8_30880 [Streptomyces sp. NPDC101175]|uniref:hypothetical protein n=1 Tax=Streptomyces sp. NPDC101175 TaxID=3366123 RepID=UPI0038323717
MAAMALGGISGPSAGVSSAATSCYGGARSATIGLRYGFNAVGPYYTTNRCRDVNVRLTYVRYQTDARSCLERANGSTISCSVWKRLPYPGWTTLSTNVRDNNRFRLEFRTQPGEVISYLVAS